MYEKWKRVLVFSSGGMGKAATVTYRRLVSLLSDKWNSPYSLIMGWLRCSLGFSLLHSSLMYLRGAQVVQVFLQLLTFLSQRVTWLHAVTELPTSFSVGLRRCLFCRYELSDELSLSNYNLVYFYRDMWVEGSAIRAG